MVTIVLVVLTFWIAFKLGRKYQDLQDIMLARRVAKLVDQRDQLDKERLEWERMERQDKRIAQKMEEATE